MLGTHSLGVFAATVLVVNATPGVDMMLVLTRTLRHGAFGGIAAALGVAAGCVVHTLVAAFGVAALLAASSAAFAALKWADAAYLLWLAFAMLRDAARPHADAALDASRRAESPGAARLFAQGLLTNVLNPKVALFFLAFLPQFIDPKTPTRVSAFLLLGAVFMFNGTLWCLLLAWFAGSVSQKVRDNPRAQIAMKRGTGALFIGLGTKLAVDR